MPGTLPIHAALPALRAALAAHSSAVLAAPPGAGKTTVVPLALRDEGWLGGQRVVMLEPRRVAARAAARFMARSLGESVGETVGFRVRGETRVSARTRVEVVTEGVLTRMLQDDPGLEGTGLVIFDEFHERNLPADIGLALTLEAQQALRPELRILVMSATLDGVRVAELLGGAPVVESEGRAWPVRTIYRQRPVTDRIEGAVAAEVRASLDEDDGDLLVFLPGVGEIGRTAALLGGGLPAGVRVLELHGSLPAERQDEALAAAPPGTRKVVLATSIAESSVTVDGVRVVIDSGLARVPRFSPRTGMTRLETVRVSRASADQRRGRAGRQGEGTCRRLWTEGEHAGLVPYTRPEILEADLSPLALDLAVAGVRDPSLLRWLDPPPAAAFAQARALLAQLGALDAGGALTAHGRAMSRMGVAPRLAHMLLRSAELGLADLASELAALAEERDILRGEGGPPPADLRLRVELLRRGGRETENVRRIAKDLRARLDVPGSGSGGHAHAETAGLLLAFAYPDRVAQRRPEAAGRYLLANGRGVTLRKDDPLAMTDWLVCTEIDDAGSDARILRAAPVELEALREHAPALFTTADEVAYDDATERVTARRVERVGAIEVRHSVLRDVPAERVAGALVDAVRRGWPATMRWSEPAQRLRERLAFLHALDASWPDVSDAALLATLDDWLAPHVGPARRLADVQALDQAELLLARVGWERRRQLDELAPPTIEVPTGSRIAVDYAEPSAPVLAVKLQELFGLGTTPAVGGGRVPLMLHLLSPARRPVAVTNDLARFWRVGYPDVRKDLRGRYPKHPWPEDPVTAVPMRGTTKRGV